MSVNFDASSYGDLPPLDGEEGELIDDEACLIDVLDVRAVTGIGEFSFELSVAKTDYRLRYFIPESDGGGQAHINIFGSTLVPSLSWRMQNMACHRIR